MTRSELYAAVWAEPMSTLARRLGMSDSGLIKACRRDNIPTPGRGYWAQLAAGRPVAPVPLPLADGDPEVTFPRVGPAPMAAKRPAFLALMSRLGQDADSLADAPSAAEPPEVSDDTRAAATPAAAPITPTVADAEPPVTDYGQRWPEKPGAEPACTRAAAPRSAYRRELAAGLERHLRLAAGDFLTLIADEANSLAEPAATEVAGWVRDLRPELQEAAPAAQTIRALRHLAAGRAWYQVAFDENS